MGNESLVFDCILITLNISLKYNSSKTKIARSVEIMGFGTQFGLEGYIIDQAK